MRAISPRAIEAPTCSVLVPTYNRCDQLKRLLLALDAMDPGGPSFEVIVADDGSTDDTEGMLAGLRVSYPLRIVQGLNGGPAAARNRAILVASGDVLLFLDDDVIPLNGLIESHLEVHRRDHDALVTGPMAAPVGEPMPPWLTWEAATLQKQYEAMAAHKWAPTWRQFYTANASLRREHALAVGGFNEQYRRAEDIEFAGRLAGRGARFYFVPAATVIHGPDRTLESWIRNGYEYGRHDVLMGRDFGEIGILRRALRESKSRQLVNRVITRFCVGHRHRTRAVLTLFTAIIRLRHHALLPLQLGLCSIVFNTQYWQGIADASGSGAGVWSRLVAQSGGGTIATAALNE